MDEPIIDLQSDHYFMGEALRQAAKAYEAEEVPVGAVIVRDGRVIARAFNQVELLHDATAHAEMLALTQAEEAVGDWRLNECTLYDEGTLPDVRWRHRPLPGQPRGLRRERCEGGGRRQRVEPAPIPDAQPPVPDHHRRARTRMPRVAGEFFRGTAGEET
jgi:hypothetical protein